MKALSSNFAYVLKRPLLVAVGLWTIYNANHFDDTKFVIILVTLFGVFVTDILTELGSIKEVVEKGLETASKLRGGGDVGDN